MTEKVKTKSSKCNFIAEPPILVGPEAKMSVRLVTFLGTGNYTETTYAWQRPEGIRKCRTKFIARALAEIAEVSEVVVLPTEDAWDKNGRDFEDQLVRFGLKTPIENFWPLGENSGQLWQQFELIKDALRVDKRQVLLDITHGFRSAPFFAAAAVAFIRLVDTHSPEMQVVYGAFDARNTDNVTPIWDITRFVELLDWSRHLMLFMRTGRAADLSSAIEKLGKSLQKAWHMGGQQGTQPGIAPLSNALERFGEDVETLRTGSLLLGTPRETSSVNRLLHELKRSRSELPQHIPPVADVLDRIRSVVEQLHTNQRLSEPDGQRALKALASYYLELGRYPEAAATIREAWITQHACRRADCPGWPDFSDERRQAAEDAWYAANKLLALEIADARNDIQHAGYRSRPLPAKSIKKKIKDLIEKLDTTVKES